MSALDVALGRSAANQAEFQLIDAYTATGLKVRAKEFTGGRLLTFGEQFGEFSQVIYELGLRVLCHMVSHAVVRHVVRVPVPAVLLAVQTQVGS